MDNSKGLLVAALVGAMVWTTALSANASDLTGTWSGSIGPCAGRDSSGASVDGVFENVTLEISDSGTALAVSVSGFGDFPMDGVAYDFEGQPNRRAAAALANCANDGAVAGAATDEVWYLRVGANDANGRGRMFGTRNSGDLGFVGSCKLRFRRIDTADPGATGCP